MGDSRNLYNEVHKAPVIVTGHRRVSPDHQNTINFGQEMDVVTYKKGIKCQASMASLTGPRTPLKRTELQGNGCIVWQGTWGECQTGKELKFRMSGS